MLVVGLTGGIASGKSTASRMFQEIGSLLIDADQIGRMLVEPDKPTWQRVVDRFGPRVVQIDGQLKRKVLAKTIFDSDIERWALNAIMHPPIVAEIEKQLEGFSETHPRSVVIADIPLLFEVEWPFEWDKIIVVVADRVVRLARLRLHDRKMNRYKFEKQMRSQLFLHDKAKRADWVIDNNGSLQHTRDQVITTYQQLQRIAEQNTA